MPIPDYQTLMLPVLRLAAEGERRVGEVAEIVADQFGLGPDERAEMLPSGRQRVLHNRIHWAKFYMSKAGLIAAPARGRFIATEAGRRVLAENPARIDTAFLMREPTFRAFYRNEGLAGDTGAPDGIAAAPAEAALAPRETPQDRIEAAHQEIQSALREELLQRISQNSPTFFEDLIVNLLVAMGYGGGHRNAAARLGRSGDGGIDGVIDEDRLGLDRVYVQAKRYGATTVGRPDVQGFVGSLVGLGASKGVFVTTSTFSAQAREFVRHLTQRVILIDGPLLADLMIEHGVGVRTIQTLALKRLDEDFFAEED
jgi:restriction system protein